MCNTNLTCNSFRATPRRPLQMLHLHLHLVISRLFLLTQMVHRLPTGTILARQEDLQPSEQMPRLRTHMQHIGKFHASRILVLHFTDAALCRVGRHTAMMSILHSSRNGLRLSNSSIANTMPPRGMVELLRPQQAKHHHRLHLLLDLVLSSSCCFLVLRDLILLAIQSEKCEYRLPRSFLME